MRGLWATLGICCLDEAARAEILRRLPVGEDRDRGVLLADLKRLQRHLRRQYALDLSRWELKELYRFWRPREEKYSVEEILPKISRHFSKRVRTSDLELCRVVGLACIDERFRRDLYNGSRNRESDTSGLKATLVGQDDIPQFPRLRSTDSDDDYRRLNRLMAKSRRVDGEPVWRWMQEIEHRRWKSPEGGVDGNVTACSAGHYIDPDEENRVYWHVNQPEFDDLLASKNITVQKDGETPVRFSVFLREHGAIV